MVSKCRSPISVQFEITYRCNNKCQFCYNHISTKANCELDTQTTKLVLDQIWNAEIFSVNFNGGEPLLRNDFFQITEYANQLGLNLHLNTNANLIGALEAKHISMYFPSICTSILSFNESIHDSLSGRKGAFQDMLNGIHYLKSYGVYLAANVMVCNSNHIDFEKTLKFLHSESIETLLITRLIPSESNYNRLHISTENFIDVLRKTKTYQDKYNHFKRIGLPQPIPICDLPDDLKSTVQSWNIPCTVGLCTLSISPDGLMHPCTLVDTPVLGDASKGKLYSSWKNFNGNRFFEKNHLQSRCLDCNLLSQCGGGCMGYNNAMK